MSGTCKAPDRDVPKLVCGYPLPCPFHTAMIDLTGPLPEVQEPFTAGVSNSTRRALIEIAEALGEADATIGTVHQEKWQ